MAKTTSAAAPLPNTGTLTRTWLLGFAVALAACGGGGGDDPPVNTPSFRVGGQLAGLGAGKTVVIADASGPSAAVSANGSYSLQLPAGTAYSLRIAAQPVGQTCTIANGSGTVSADVNNVSVSCLDNEVPPTARTLGGSVAGLAAGQALVLQLAAEGTTQEARVTADGPFTFAQPITGPYSISVLTQPQNQTCTVTVGLLRSTIESTCRPLPRSSVPRMPKRVAELLPESMRNSSFLTEFLSSWALILAFTVVLSCV